MSMQVNFIVTVASAHIAMCHWLISPLTITMVVLIVKTVTVNDFVQNVLRVVKLFDEVYEKISVESNRSKHLLIEFDQDSFLYKFCSH